ncbi:MAG: hypothetical protein RXO22_02935 [Thermocladium sp.]
MLRRSWALSIGTASARATGKAPAGSRSPMEEAREDGVSQKGNVQLARGTWGTTAEAMRGRCPTAGSGKRWNC